MKKSAREISCNCIDSLMNIKESIEHIDSLVIECFYKGSSEVIEDKYYANGRKRLKTFRFFIISGEILYYLENKMYYYCPAYKEYIDETNRQLIRFK